MSIKIMTEVWEHSKHAGSALLTLLAIADRANDDGGAWPGVDELSRKARVTRRYTFSILSELEKSGELVMFNRAKDEGGYTSNAYVIVVGCGILEANERIQKAHAGIRGIINSERGDLQFTPPSDLQFTPPVIPSSPESSIEPSEETPPSVLPLPAKPNTQWITDLYLQMFSEPPISGEIFALDDIAGVYARADIEAAMKIAKAKNERQRVMRKVSYINSILQGWKANGGRPEIVGDVMPQMGAGRRVVGAK